MTDYDKIEYITKTIKDLLAAGGISAQVEYEDSLANGLLFNIVSPDARALIGHQGSVLYALELLIHAMVAKQFALGATPVQFSIDIDGYKKKRQWFLKQMAKEAVDKVKHSGESVALPPMPKYERKYIHLYIQEQFPHITTESIGDDPNRKIKLSM